MNQPNTYAKVVRISDSGTSHTGMYVFQVPTGVTEMSISFKASNSSTGQEKTQTLSCTFDLET